MSRVIERCEQLAAITDVPGQIHRLYLSRAYMAGLEQVAGWMRESGMETWTDAAGNLWGRYAATASAGARAPTLILGSHLDTIPNAGAYDGVLGVVSAIEAVARLDAAGKRLPFHIDVVGFGDEEGVRFPASMLGARAVCGQWPTDGLDLVDADGVTLREALVDCGLDPDRMPQASRANDRLLGYWELHMEQGPVLEDEALPVGVVSAIAGARRFRIRIDGEAGHAGTVPMNLRRDALTAVSELILVIERISHSLDLVATVGQVNVRPGAVNVIPASAECTLDIRSIDEAKLDKAMAQIRKSAEIIAEKRRVEVEWQEFHRADARQCAPAFRQIFEDAMAQRGLPLRTLPSGAGHDAMLMADITDMAMLFVRCKGGISHNPAEFVSDEDAETAVEVLGSALALLAEQTNMSQERAS